MFHFILRRILCSSPQSVVYGKVSDSFLCVVVCMHMYVYCHVLSTAAIQFLIATIFPRRLVCICSINLTVQCFILFLHRFCVRVHKQLFTARFLIVFMYSCKCAYVCVFSCSEHCCCSFSGCYYLFPAGWSAYVLLI